MLVDSGNEHLSDSFSIPDQPIELSNQSISRSKFDQQIVFNDGATMHTAYEDFDHPPDLLDRSSQHLHESSRIPQLVVDQVSSASLPTNQKSSRTICKRKRVEAAQESQAVLLLHCQ